MHAFQLQDNYDKYDDDDGPVIKKLFPLNVSLMMFHNEFYYIFYYKQYSFLCSLFIHYS